jgi:GTP 3',8-cyclase
MEKIIDPAGRHIKKLRISLTEACDFRCFYCMPEGTKFAGHNDIMRPEEFVDICGELVKRGISHIRVTGGEPLLSPDFRQIMESLDRLSLKRFSLTTNGNTLHNQLDFLEKTSCRYINYSLDTLNAASFKRITASANYDRVLKTIIESKQRGFKVKINTVLFRGINDHEVNDFVNFAEKYKIEVRFLELMRIGPSHAENRKYFIPVDEVIDRLKLTRELSPIVTAKDSTSFDFRTNAGGRLGFIASESKPFCSGCSRLRLSAKGKLRACLMSEGGHELRGLNKSEIARALEDVIGLKPLDRIHHVDGSMHAIGG